MEKVFLNDKLVDADKAGVSVADGGLLYGAGLFETMRSYNSKVFRLQDHLERLFSSASTLSINNSYDKDFVTGAVYELLKANGLSDARLRLTLTSGSMSQVDDEPKSTLIITATQCQSYPDSYYKDGVLVVLCPFRQNPYDPVCGHKTINYFSNMLGLDFARKAKATEAIRFTTDNRLAEGCISNVFLVSDGVVFTPLVKTPVLAGVMRKTVCEIAAKNSIELVEKDLYIDDLLGAEEVFLTNVIMQIMPVSKVEKHQVGKEGVGAVTKKLRKCFDELIDAEYGESK